VAGYPGPIASAERPNIFKTALEPDDSDPVGYRIQAVKLGPRVGATRLGASIYELPPGESVCPYHYEHAEEEWVIVLSGRPTLRTPEGEEELEAGDVVCFAPGPAGAHKLSNRSEEALRLLMFSEVKHPAVTVYPDSDKIGVWTGGDRSDDVMVERSSSVDYYHGEPPQQP
jgi:uncharacterized cupin superfamily protein